MRFMDDESITGPKEFAVGNYLVQMVRSFSASFRADKPNSYIWWVTSLLDVWKKGANSLKFVRREVPHSNQHVS